MQVNNFWLSNRNYKHKVHDDTITIPPLEN